MAKTATRRRSTKGDKATKAAKSADVRQAAKAIQNGQADPLAVNATDDDLPPALKRGKGPKYVEGQRTLVDDLEPAPVPELAEECDRILAIEVKRKELKTELDERKGNVGGLLKAHDRDIYIHKGEKFYVVPAGEEVKHTKVNTRG